MGIGFRNWVLVQRDLGYEIGDGLGRVFVCVYNEIEEQQSRE